MPVEFYDNREPGDAPEVADIDRVYCLDWNRFGDVEWSSLDRIYRALPGWAGYHEVPWWFGADEGKGPHLFATVEPSGLQVCGILPRLDWLDWSSRFEEATADLPSFVVT